MVKQNAISWNAMFAAHTQNGEIQDASQVFYRMYERNVVSGNMMISGYGNDGRIEDAYNVSGNMKKIIVASWNTMIIGYAQHGPGNEALQFFGKMHKEGVKPNHISFMGALSVGNHTGLAEATIHYFDSTSQDYCIKPIPEHYACMVDLFGRSGHLEEAHDFIKEMPFEPDVVVQGEVSQQGQPPGEHIREEFLSFV